MKVNKVKKASVTKKSELSTHVPIYLQDEFESLFMSRGFDKVLLECLKSNIMYINDANVVYYGFVENSHFNGLGVLKRKNMYYKGDFKNSMFHGEGHLIRENVEYEGMFYENQIYGKGVMKFTKLTNQNDSVQDNSYITIKGNFINYLTVIDVTIIDKNIITNELITYEVLYAKLEYKADVVNNYLIECNGKITYTFQSVNEYWLENEKLTYEGYISKNMPHDEKGKLTNKNYQYIGDFSSHQSVVKLNGKYQIKHLSEHSNIDREYVTFEEGVKKGYSIIKFKNNLLDWHFIDNNYQLKNTITWYERGKK